MNYREAYNLFVCNGILFNHESPRRGETFVTRKITRGLANILAGREDKLYLGNLAAKRDWGFAPEYIECQWRILQQDKPDDYVIGTGESHTVEQFVEAAFAYVISIGMRMSKPIPGIFAPPKSITYVQISPRRSAYSAGHQASPFMSWSKSWSMLICRPWDYGKNLTGEGQTILLKNGFDWIGGYHSSWQEVPLDHTHQ